MFVDVQNRVTISNGIDQKQTASRDELRDDTLEDHVPLACKGGFIHTNTLKTKRSLSTTTYPDDSPRP